jgi:predicted Zn-dependent protease
VPASEFVTRCPADERSRLAAEIAYSSGDWDEAADGLRAVLDRSPGDYSTAIRLANALLVNDRFREALDAASVAAGIDTSDWEPYELMARAFEGLGNAKGACKARARAEELKEKCRTRPAGRLFAG